MNEKIKWSSRINPVLIERLYQSDALGMQDNELCDDVAYRLYLRCQAILMVAKDEVACPKCETVFTIDTSSTEAITPCPARCGWTTTMLAYRQSWSKKRIWAANALPAFEEFNARYSPTLEYKTKMLLIDKLIHSFHWSLKENLPARTAANNLIEGSHDQVVTFLDNLSSFSPETKSAWRATMQTMMKRRKEK